MEDLETGCVQRPKRANRDRTLVWGRMAELRSKEERKLKKQGAKRCSFGEPLGEAKEDPLQKGADWTDVRGKKIQ